MKVAYTNTLADYELAYIAGFFDGEGSITIHENCKPSPRGKNPNHTLQVAIGNTDPRVLVWIQSVFGGGLGYRKSTKPRNRGIAQWVIRAAAALPFLEAIRPFIRMKGDQCDIAITYQRTKARRGSGSIPLDMIAWREAQRQAIKTLNAREWIQ